MRKLLLDAQRIVVKVGTSTLTHDTGKLNLARVERLVRVLVDLQNRGKNVVLVTSGAVGVGVRRLGLAQKPTEIPKKQAAAAIGQCELMAIYDKFFLEYGQIVAQILLTKDVISVDVRKQNVTNTFETLIAMGVIPIVNENDTVSTEEIEFGDNDTLSAVVASVIHADALVILSDVDGLYDCDPNKNQSANIIHTVTGVTSEIAAMAGGAGSARGTGGMATKIIAAGIAVNCGCHMVIANGSDPAVINRVFAGEEVGTMFVAGKK